jgi:signal transduction histidine kinase
MTGTTVLMASGPIWEAFLDLARRGVKIRFITEIAPQNIDRVREFMRIAEVRHAEPNCSIFAVADGMDYVCISEAQDGSLSKVIACNLPQFVHQQKFFFETLWERAIPAEVFIQKVEHGVEPERTEVVYSRREISRKVHEALGATKNSVDICQDRFGPSNFAASPDAQARLGQLRDRGIRIRHIVEITRDNIADCRKIREFSELRHVDGLKGYFLISDSNFLASNSSENPERSQAHSVITNSPGLVKQQQYLFNQLWEKSIDCELRFLELESGLERERTEVWEGGKAILKNVLASYDQIRNHFDACLDPGSVKALAASLDVMKGLEGLSRRGIKLRILTEINNENLVFCRRIMEFAELRHLEVVKGDFAVTDVWYEASASYANSSLPKVIFSNIKPFVEHQQNFFDSLWSKGMDAPRKIQQIQEGRLPEKTELIPDTRVSIALAQKIMSQTKHELLVLWATAGTLQFAATPENSSFYRDAIANGAKLRMLVPFSPGAEETKRKMEDLTPGIDIKISEGNLSSRITILVSDRKEFMSWELVDDSLPSPFDAGGLATYSNLKGLAQSYAVIFDQLWNATELAENLRSANAQLEENDKAMKDFIDIAAHELRNPIQPIIGLTELLQDSKTVAPEQKKILDIVLRNARRLLTLSEEVLDITRIESGNLHLQKVETDIFWVAQRIMERYNNAQNLAPGSKKFIRFRSMDASPLLATIDPERIGQVIENLLSNAVKFTGDSGTIEVAIERVGGKTSETERQGAEMTTRGGVRNAGQEYALISISDDGTGVSKEIQQRLFDKFASDSEKGMGLGLYICKKIIEAHGGEIWLENKSPSVPGANEHGATFCFTLPLKIQ